MIKDFIIIGAGMSGLNTSLNLKQLNLGSILVLDKSRGVGGRMATRRTLNSRFDHGAQFYRVKDDITKLHHRWKEGQISHEWFVSSEGNHWCAQQGMTSLAKSMIEEVEVLLEKEIESIHQENGLWKLKSKKDEEWLCHNLIISSPLPQTIKLINPLIGENLLESHALSKIKSIEYTKAVVALVTLTEEINLTNGYEEFFSGDFFP